MENECVKSRKAEGVVKVYCGAPDHMVHGTGGFSGLPISYPPSAAECVTPSLLCYRQWGTLGIFLVFAYRYIAVFDTCPYIKQTQRRQEALYILLATAVKNDPL